jgi:hypothetical protein
MVHHSDWTFIATNPVGYWSEQGLRGALVMALNLRGVPGEKCLFLFFSFWNEMLSSEKECDTFEVEHV